MSVKYDKILGKMREDDSGSGPAPEPYVLPPATSETLGGVKIGSGVNVQTDGTMSVTPYSLPAATSASLGGVKIGNGIDAQTDGTISVTPYSLPVATTSALGGIMIGDGLSASTTGTTSLAIAGASSLGGVKVGSGLSIDSSGVLSADGGGSIPIATTSDLGGIIVGNGLSVDATGKLKPNFFYLNPNFCECLINSLTNWPIYSEYRGQYMLFIAVGGGGGGAAGNVIGDTYASGGGGGGGGVKAFMVSIPSGSTSHQITITIGAGGLGGQTTNNNSWAGTNGGDTTVSLKGMTSSFNLVAYGGKGGGIGAGANDFLCMQGSEGGNCNAVYGSSGITGNYNGIMYGAKGTRGANGYISDVTSILFGGEGGEPAFPSVMMDSPNYNRTLGRGGKGGGTTSTGWEPGSNGNMGAVYLFYNSNNHQ